MKRANWQADNLQIVERKMLEQSPIYKSLGLEYSEAVSLKKAAIFAAQHDDHISFFIKKNEWKCHPENCYFGIRYDEVNKVYIGWLETP